LKDELYKIISSIQDKHSIKYTTMNAITGWLLKRQKAYGIDEVLIRG
jgi:hypothetical protein